MEVLRMLFLGSTLAGTRDIAFDRITMEEARAEPKFFTRNRKMTFPSILMLLLKGVQTSTQSFERYHMPINMTDLNLHARFTPHSCCA